jgi:hypothetical protein
MKFKKSITLISLGSLNFIHGILHVIQFFQSMIMATSHSHSHGFFDTPVFAFIWAILGFVSLWIGIKDFKHHKDCHD